MSEPIKRLFVSYAHRDEKWLAELQKFLVPWLSDKRLAVWSDRQIAPGQAWAKSIEEALADARVAVLLVSSNFLASSFILQHELPQIVRRAKANQLTLLWVAVGASAYQATALADFQAVNDPNRPLDAMPKPERERALVEIARKIADASTLRTLAGGLQMIDETTEPMEAALDRRPADPGRVYGVQARFDAAGSQITFSGATTRITMDDVAKLPAPDREFIADLDDALERNYKRWSAVRDQLGDAGGALDDEVRRQMSRIATLMCQDLTSILDFLRDMHKAELDDHYGRYRFICARLHSQ